MSTEKSLCKCCGYPRKLLDKNGICIFCTSGYGGGAVGKKTKLQMDTKPMKIEKYN